MLLYMQIHTYIGVYLACIWSHLTSQIFPYCYYKTAPTAVPDASDLTHTGNSRPYTLGTRADIKANFCAFKAACYSEPNLNDFSYAKYQ